MKILGIDPGLGRAGWAVVEEQNGKVSAINYGCIETSKSSKEEMRIKTLYSELIKIIEKYNPEVLSVEKLFFNKNVKTALSVGQARGVIILASVNKGLIVEEYTPLQVKIAVAGYGRADKNQIGQMVKSSFNLKSVPQPDDAADALAIALTHAVSYKIRNLA
jgi:crossover junction endodeoxyribonuclease RuvC